MQLEQLRVRSLKQGRRLALAQSSRYHWSRRCGFTRGAAAASQFIFLCYTTLKVLKQLQHLQWTHTLCFCGSSVQEQVSSPALPNSLLPYSGLLTLLCNTVFFPAPDFLPSPHSDHTTGKKQFRLGLAMQRRDLHVTWTQLMRSSW